MAKASVWMPIYIGDYLSDTTHLTCEQHGAYTLLLYTAWKNNGTLPDDDNQLAMITRLQIEKWKEYRPIIQRFFDPGWRQKRLLYELKKANKRKEVAQINGLLGGRPNYSENKENNPAGNPAGYPTPNPEKTSLPLPSQEQEITITAKPKPASRVKKTYSKETQALYSYYVQTVRPSKRKTDALEWIERRVAQFDAAELLVSISRHIKDEDLKAGYKFECANFFGNKEIYKGYLEKEIPEEIKTRAKEKIKEWTNAIV